MHNFVFSIMKELLKMSPMSYFPVFYYNSFLWKFNSEGWILHSAVISEPELCKRDGLRKTRLVTNIDGYSLRLVFLYV